MPTVLLRLGRRRTSWEAGADLETLLNVEFVAGKFRDLSPSVYEIEPSQENVVRAHAEHAASANLNPSGARHIDLSGRDRFRKVQGSSRFTFTRQCHGEVVFASERDLRVFVEEILASISERQTFTISEKELIGYAKGLICGNDEEWTDFCADCEQSSKSAKWGCDSIVSCEGDDENDRSAR